MSTVQIEAGSPKEAGSLIQTGGGGGSEPFVKIEDGGFY